MERSGGLEEEVWEEGEERVVAVVVMAAAEALAVAVLVMVMSVVPVPEIYLEELLSGRRFSSSQRKNSIRLLVIAPSDNSTEGLRKL